MYLTSLLILFSRTLQDMLTFWCGYYRSRSISLGVQWVTENHHLLRKVPDCEYCGALKFHCCRKGKVNIYVHQLPVEMRCLFESEIDHDAKYFRNNIHYFNSHFSFTSFGATVDQHLATAKGMYIILCLILSV
jgi:hypothetical protein